MTMHATQKPGLQWLGGIPVMVPNTVYPGEGFYISHNTHDRRIYGDVTTALVLQGDETAFYILNGDHREGYAPLLALGLAACMEYFQQHIDQMSKYSEVPQPTA